MGSPKFYHTGPMHSCSKFTTPGAYYSDIVQVRGQVASPARRGLAGPLANDNGVACGEREAIV